MKAAYIQETGPPDIIKVAELPRPEVGANDVLVKVQAAAVDPIDTYIRRGTYKLDLPYPFIVGRDMVGTVEEVGANVTGFKSGDRVWCNNQGYAGRQGTFAEFISVAQGLLYHLPDGIDALNAVASAHSALTSVLALTAKARLQSGETLFINGGSGNVGTCATQLAKSIGAVVVVTAGSTEKAEYCRQCGADAVIDYKKDDLSAAVKKFAPNGVDVYWDLTRQPEVQLAMNLTRAGGRILLSSGMAHQSTFSIGDFYTRNYSMFGFTITSLKEAELSQYAEVINRELANDTFKTQIAKIFPLSQAALAHDMLEKDEPSGKIIVQIA